MMILQPIQFQTRGIIPLVSFSVSCYSRLMTIEQIVEIPANHRLTIEVPNEIPAGRAIIAFTSAPDRRSTDDDGLDYEGECPICAKNRDPITGNPRYNAETIAAFEEAKAIMRGEIPAKRYNSLEEAWKDLDL